MPFYIVHQDLTAMQCDAIVNPTDPFFSGSGGTDLAIHTAAGPALSEECLTLPWLETGSTAVTSGYRLQCKYVIHTVGPIWTDGTANESILLRSCYLNALMLAKKMELDSVAFPLISSGTFGFPKDKVLRIAIDAISDFLLMIDEEPDVFICVLDRNSYTLSRDIALKEYLNWNTDAVSDRSICLQSAPKGKVCAEQSDLAAWLKKQDDTFAVTLLKLIDRSGMTSAQCYKKANVSKQTFYKINNDAKYRPSKATVIAFAIALRLDLEQTEILLRSAGFSLSHNNNFDMIIEFYIKNGVYDIFEINAALYQYDQVCLGDRSITR